jgi:hypothetical protein
VKRIRATVIAGLLLLMLILPQLTLAAGPGISNVSVTDITDTSAAITWITNNASDSRVNYGTTTPLSKHKDDSEDVTHHYIILEALTSGTKYFFAVESDGERSPADPSEYYSFTTLAPTEYRITLDHACGVCGELVEPGVCGEVLEVTAIVAAAGTYHICWDSRTEANVKGTFTVTTATSYTLALYMPEAKKGIHTVYLTDNTYAEKAKAEFEVLPSAKMDHDKGPVGTEVTINGYGYDASQNIRVSLLGEEKTDKANTVGSWEVIYTIPDTPAGGYTFNIDAKEGTVWVTWVRKYFTVTPEITVTPSSGTVGQTVKVEGTGFAGEEEDIEVTFDGVVRKEGIHADEDGSWDAIITIPPCHSGSYAIDASGTFTRARDVNDVEFVVGAGILVEPSLAYVEDTITVAGGGFLPGEDGIKVTFGGNVVAADILADKTGCWETSFVLPASTHGDNTVSASGMTTAAVETVLTTKAKVEGISPVEGAPGDSVTISGSGFYGNKELTVTVGGLAVQGNMQTQSNGNIVATFRVPAGSIAGNQTVVVADEDGATDSVDFVVKEKVLPTPLPVSPQDESKLRSGIVTFQWQGITSNSEITYNLQISETAGFASIFRSKSDIEEFSYALNKEEALPRGTYYWRVKAIDDYGNESPWSDYSSFTASPIPTWVWVVVGVVVLVVLMVVAYRETKFRITK